MADKFEEIEARVLHPEQGHVHLLQHSRDLVIPGLAEARCAIVLER